MNIVPLIGAEVPLEELLPCATPTQDEHVESVKEHTYTGGICITDTEVPLRRAKKEFRLYRSEAKEQGLTDLKARGRHTLNSLLVKKSFSILNEYHHKKKKLIKLEQLVDLLLAEYPTIFGDEMTMHSAYEAGMNGLKSSDISTWDYAHTACESAAMFAMDHFDAEVYRRIQERARAGGRAGKKYSREDYVATLGMSKAEIARKLGISRPTVYAMIREYENERLGMDDD